eukprot:7772692-Pyramimonas_sp.AAC.1
MLALALVYDRTGPNVSLRRATLFGVHSRRPSLVPPPLYPQWFPAALAHSPPPIRPARRRRSPTGEPRLALDGPETAQNASKTAR